MSLNINKTLSASILIIFTCFFAFLPADAHAVTSVAPKPKFEVAGWIPYWRSATGTQDALAHLGNFTQLNPFGYTIKQDGSLHDNMGVSKEPWVSFIKTAKSKKVRITPTVMAHDGATIHELMSDPVKRAFHEDEIVRIVKENGFDGIDLDYEGKLAETKPYFSLFLKELYKKMGNKWVMCTIEARTPLTSRFDTIPPDIEYANDFVAINKYCDRVMIMAYDQGSIDIRLNAAKTGPYIPVADTKWVKKVVELAAKDIKKSKIVIGVATYGYEYTVTPLTEGYRYDRQWSFNPRYALEIASRLGISAVRNQAGELSFSYNTSTLPPASISEAKESKEVSQNILPTSDDALFTTTNKTILPPSSSQPFNIVWWSDAQAIKEKITLAKELGVRGVAIFKIDGGLDPAIWKVLPKVR